jgi:hypothetical protein
MHRRGKVELFEQIRREYRFGVGTIRPSAALSRPRTRPQLAVPCPLNDERLLKNSATEPSFFRCVQHDLC